MAELLAETGQRGNRMVVGERLGRVVDDVGEGSVEIEGEEGALRIGDDSVAGRARIGHG